jgi:KaiC/GvpD/RAD55 family RecA-like ATPase
MNAASWRQTLNELDTRHHVAKLYRNDEQLAEVVCHYIEEGLRRGDAVIVVATTDHWESFLRRLAVERDFDIADAVMRGQLRILNAQLTLSAFMAEGMPQWDDFREAIGSIIMQTRKRFGEIRIYGEMVDVLWEEQNRKAANRLEEFWNDLAEQHDFSLLCAYHVEESDPSDHEEILECICKTHSRVFPVSDHNI